MLSLNVFYALLLFTLIRIQSTTAVDLNILFGDPIDGGRGFSRQYIKEVIDDARFASSIPIAVLPPQSTEKPSQINTILVGIAILVEFLLIFGCAAWILMNSVGDENQEEEEEEDEESDTETMN